MKSFRIEFTSPARYDRRSIYSWIAANGSPERADRFIDKLLLACDSLRTAPLRGTVRFIRGRQVRVIGHGGTVSIVFTVDNDSVQILRLLYRGRDVATAHLR